MIVTRDALLEKLLTVLNDCDQTTACHAAAKLQAVVQAFAHPMSIEPFQVRVMSDHPALEHSEAHDIHQ